MQDESQTPTSQAAVVLIAAGWAITDGTPDGEVRMTSPDGAVVVLRDEDE